MKTLIDVKTELAALREKGQELNGAELRRLTLRIKHLEKVRLYLEHEPTTETLRKQKQVLKRLLAVINDRYLQWYDGKPQGDQRAMRRQYEELYEVRKLRAQLRTLNYILDET